VTLVQKTGESLAKIAEHVDLIDQQINTISTGAAEQLTGVQEVNAAVNSMDQMTQQNAAMVEENTALTHQMSDEVKYLADLIGNFKVKGVAKAKPSAEVQTAEPQAKTTVGRMVNKVASAFGASKGSAAVAVDHNADNWDEF